MKEMIIIIRPEKLEKVKQILDKAGLGGISISSVMGCGTQRGTDAERPFEEFKASINLLPKIRVEVVVDDEKVENLIAKISEEVATGNAGDGKIFIRSIEEVVRIRTGERGKKAL